ncbi:hypothetical protein [Gluconobacter oxydans]|uniref:Uncharacterized protein n=2 Tax=Gluconobacter TaxID=441 RepID=Q5HXS0_GLUOX|nr:hypothetical protein [Gluconobacter oxydans]AAW59683.1 hypothetical protein GOX2619 [Gluconobacter oxydans 621H]KXV34237.1 hypothetical protein AD940_07495 [Gluconobacter thailandicus]
MRREDTGEVVEMLRPQKRSTDRTGKQTEDGQMPQEAELSGNRADAPEETTESRRKPLKAQNGTEDRATRTPRSRLLVGTALAVLGAGGLLGGAVAVGAHFGVPIPFVNDRPRASITTTPDAPAVPSARKSAFTLAPPALGTPDVPEKRIQQPSVAQNDDPFGGEGMTAPVDPPATTKPAEIKAAPVIPVPPAVADGAPNASAMPTSQAVSAPQAQSAVSAAPAAAPLPSVASPSPDAALELEMAKQLKTLDDHVAALQKNVDAMQDNLTATLNRGLGEFKGRLDELQHHEDQTDRALQASQSALTHPAHDHSSAAPVTPRAVSVAQPHPSAEPSTPKPAPVHLPQFTVQAGAPGIAILQDEQGNASRVEAGSVIPGWGPVITITSSGSRWVVRTPKGLIH